MQTNLKLFDLLRGSTGAINADVLIYELIYIYDRYRKEGKANKVVEESYNSQNLLNMMIGHMDSFGGLFKEVVRDYERKIR